MAKPHIKLKTARAARPAPKAQQSRDMDRLMIHFSEAIGMSVGEVMRDPYAAARWKSKVAEHKQARRREAAKLTPVAEQLGWSVEQAADASKVAIEKRVEEMKQEYLEKCLTEERARQVEIIRACQVTGQDSGLMLKLVNNGYSLDRAREHIFDVAAAKSDARGIHNSHSPEGGHRAGIDYQKIYDRQNRKKGGAA